MKRKDVQRAINEVGAMTMGLDGAMTVFHKESGEEIEVDFPTTLAVARGVLAWVDCLIDADEAPAGHKLLESLMVCIGKSIAFDLGDDEEE